jgi:hypothetical protein
VIQIYGNGVTDKIRTDAAEMKTIRPLITYIYLDGIVVHYLSTLYQLQRLFNVGYSGRVISFGHSGRTSKGADIVCGKLVHRNLYGITEENHKISGTRLPVTQSIFEPGTYRTQVRSVTA